MAKGPGLLGNISLTIPCKTKICKKNYENFKKFRFPLIKRKAELFKLCHFFSK